MSSKPEDDGTGEHDGGDEVPPTDLQDDPIPEIDVEDVGEELQDVNTARDQDVDTIPQLEPHESDSQDVASSINDEPTATNGTHTPKRSFNPAMASPLASSVDDSASIPDDTPSVQDSGFSSPSRDVRPALAVLSRKSSTASRQPFERRFQSRLSSSFLGSPRASSPAFLNVHSRHSSLASFAPASESAADEQQAPWEVIRWTRLRKLTGQAFSETGKRNFGSPTCLAVTDHIVIGTSRGLILVFDHQQNSKAIIGSGTPAQESGPITSLAISADHTAIAAGHAQGHIFTWEISRPSRPFLHIPALEAAQPESRKGDGHIKGSAVLHIGFLGYRRTALVSADDKGMAFSHLASRGTGSIARSVKTTRILGRYPELVVRKTEKPVKKSSVLAFSPLPLGNVEQSTDGLGLVAMLTPYLLVIVSTTPVAQTQHKAARPKEVAAHSAMTAALAWFPAIKLKGSDVETSKTKLVYAWSNTLTVLEVNEAPKDEDTAEGKQPELQFLPRSRYHAEEAIIAVQWLSRSVLAVLTITQQLLIIEDVSMTVTDSFDMIQKNIYHADLFSQQLQAIVEHHDEEDPSLHGVVADGYHMSFRGYKGRLFVLGVNDIWWGSLTNWADRLLAMMETGDYIRSIRLATNYYLGVGEKVTVGLPEDDEARHLLVRDKLLEMMSASLRYAFGKNEKSHGVPEDRTQLIDLAVVCISACLKINDQDFLFDEVFTWYDDNDAGDVFVDVLEPHILDRQIASLPPAAVKTLINHFSQTHAPAQLEEIICLLDATAMDVDQVTTLCKQHNLWEAFMYVWNTALMDYVSPMEELLKLVSRSPAANTSPTTNGAASDYALKIFPYLSFILTGRVYPLGEFMEDDRSDLAKSQVYDALFSGRSTQNQKVTLLHQLLLFDTPNFMATMNEAFEDPFLNTSQDTDIDGNDAGRSSRVGSIYNRQIIVRMLLEVMSSGFTANDTIYLDMFIARNLPKYPQYMLLPGTILERVFTRLCNVDQEVYRDDAQLSVEYLMSVFQPANIHTLVPVLRRARFYKILKTVFRQENQWAELVEVYLQDEENQDGVFDVIVECLRDGSQLDSKQRHEVTETIKSHVVDLVNIETVRAAQMIDTVLPQEHAFCLQSLDETPSSQYAYLQALLEPGPNFTLQAQNVSSLVEQYIQLMCQYQPAHVVDYINTLHSGDLQLSKVLPAMEESGNIDAAVILMAREGHVRSSMDRLVKHLSTLQTALEGVLSTALDSPDEVVTNETIEDLLSSVDKFAKVGIWLAETQIKRRSTTKGKPMAVSPKRASLQQPLSAEETLWLDFIMAIVSIAQNIGSTHTTQPGAIDEVTLSIRSTVQTVFTALLASTASIRSSTGSSAGDEFTFLRILRAFLTKAAEVSSSLSQLRQVIASIFSAYAHEESLLAISNAMLDKDLFVQVDEVAMLRKQGWRAKGQVCEICRRRVWGPGTGMAVWEGWERMESERAERGRSRPLPAKEDERGEERTGKGKAVSLREGSDVIVGSDTATPMDGSATEGAGGPIVVFACRHIYHRNCLVKRSEGAATNIGKGANTLQQVAPLVCRVCHPA